jgi:hypothetical protein
MKLKDKIYIGLIFLLSRSLLKYEFLRILVDRHLKIMGNVSFGKCFVEIAPHLP